MITHHSTIARRLAEQVALSPAVCEALGAAYEQWDGQGWPGTLRGAAGPLAARIAQLAEFVEVAHRVGGIEAADELGTCAGTGCVTRRCVESITGTDDLVAVAGAEPHASVVTTPQCRQGHWSPGSLRRSSVRSTWESSATKLTS
jgi:hypothetical protein